MTLWACLRAHLMYSERLEVAATGALFLVRGKEQSTAAHKFCLNKLCCFFIYVCIK